ncbi:tRNA lysidine(34) synthetase TilS [Candidatus Curculioniphilus buchneri]|uniref:tRNA lysidine(34) synthetase TilS n=1 Tax=Candidatus Curculioniphilus buchneri TaxID=690594 RepID=UPI00376EA1BC
MNLSHSKLTQILLRRVSTIIMPYRALLLAFSGGLDSTVLLDILATMRDNSDAFELRACYIHHGLHQNSEQWATHCAHECFQRNVTFEINRIMLKVNNKGIEATARDARYRALAHVLMDNEVLLTAQHQDDQVETFLLALKRGSGPSGLSAMAKDSPFFSHRLVRPLLDCNRTEIEKYAHEHHLCWVKDDTNDDLRFDRNFLRVTILPTLHKRWPQFTSSVARSAKICAEQELLLDELLSETLKSLILPNGALRITPLITMKYFRRAAILRRWLADFGVRMPSYRQLALLWNEVVLSRCDANARLQIGNYQIRRFRDCLYLLPKDLPQPPRRDVILHWPVVNEKLVLPIGLGIILRHTFDDTSAPTVSNSLMDTKVYNNTGKAQCKPMFTSPRDITACNSQMVLFFSTVRAPLPGEQVFVRFSPISGLFHISGRCHRRTLKKIWQELNVPPWKRKITPLLFYNNLLIAGIGTFVTQEGKMQYTSEMWHLDWYQETMSVADYCIA